MTKKELSKYYYLSREIKDLEERIQTLQNQSVGVSKLTGMPFSNEKSNPVEKRAELFISSALSFIGFGKLFIPPGTGKTSDNPSRARSTGSGDPGPAGASRSGAAPRRRPPRRS